MLQGRLVMRTPTSSSLFLAYVLVLHALVFFVIYRMQGIESCERDAQADCFKRSYLCLSLLLFC